jgi:YbbR domain-containing protein
MANFPFRNIGLKFLSICIAALLWLVVAGDRVVERALRVAVEYQNLPNGLEIVGDPLESVDVRLRGSSGTLGRLEAPDTSAVIDLRNARPGRRLFHLTSAQVKVPYGVEVVQVAPATLSIEFENSAVRVLQVRPSVEGRPAPGYEVVSVKSDPATVEVVGPESALRGLDEAMTEPISVANETRPVREVVTVGVADPSVRLRAPQTATVTVQIGPGSSTKTLTGVPLNVTNADNGLRVRLLTPAVSVGLKGTHEAIQAVAPDAVQAQVDVSGLAPGDHVVEVKVQARQGLTVEAIAPRAVRVRIMQP